MFTIKEEHASSHDYELHCIVNFRTVYATSTQTYSCPRANSVSEREGLSQCTCVDGYYRALKGEEDRSTLLLYIVSVTSRRQLILK